MPESSMPEPRFSEPPGFKPTPTSHLAARVAAEGTTAVIGELLGDVPSPGQGRYSKDDLLDHSDAEWADFPLSVLVVPNTTIAAETPTLTGLSQCCVADRYSEKYGVELYLASDQRDPEGVRTTFRAHAEAGTPFGLLLSDNPLGTNFTKAGSHSTPTAVIPDRERGTCRIVQMDSMDNDLATDRTEATLSALIAESRDVGMEPELVRFPGGRQAGYKGCHIDALQILKEVLKDDAAVGRSMPSIGRENLSTDDGQRVGLVETRAPTSLHKTSQRSAFLTANNHVPEAEYGKPGVNIESHRTKHTKMLGVTNALVGTDGRNINMFLTAKGLQYAEVAAARLGSVPAEQYDQALAALTRKRVI